MLEDAMYALVELVLGNAIMVVERSLRTPADVERARDMFLAPFHNLAKLIPVVDILEIEVLDGAPVIIMPSNLRSRISSKVL